MKELVKLLLEEVEVEQHSYWYTHGNEAEEAAVRVLESVLTRVQLRLDNPEEGA